MVLGALGGSLGNHFGSQGRLGQHKEAGCPKMVLTWVPLWAPFSTFFCIYGLKMAPQTLFEDSLVAKRRAEQLERELGRPKPIFEGFGHHQNVAKT